MSDRFPIDGSRDALWMATAVAAPATEPLAGAVSCDVAIVGAGLTGLNAALDLADRGVSTTVLEAGPIGFGASGRAGGQVNLGLNEGPSALLKRFGPERGHRLIELVMRTPQTVFDRIARYRLDCDPVQNGWVQAAANERIFQDQQRVAEDYNSHAKALRVLDAQELSALSGVQGYVGGLFCAAAGSVHPLSYTRELARAAISKGARIHDRSAVSDLSQAGSRWVLRTDGGTVTADRVLVCTNGYTRAAAKAPLAGLSRRVVPVRSVLAATEPLSEELRTQVLPDQVTFVDKRRLILYARYDRDGRLCVGDHGPMRDAFELDDFKAVKKRAVSVFPQLEGVRWDYHWGGRLAMTRSGLPFLHELAPGLVAGMGYNGRGVGMGTMMGQELARYAASGDISKVRFPSQRPAGFFLHRFNKVGVSLAVKWFALRDELERVG